MEAKDGTLLAPSDEAFERTGEMFLITFYITSWSEKILWESSHFMCFDEIISFLIGFFSYSDRERLDYVLGNNYLRAEMLGLHFVRERIVSTDNRIRTGGDNVNIKNIYFYSGKMGCGFAEIIGLFSLLDFLVAGVAGRQQGVVPL